MKINSSIPYYSLIGATCCIISCRETKKTDEAVEAAKPNIVVILADDIGYGDLSVYGATTIRTPNVERLAASGIRFTNAHAVAATSTPSRYSLLTGQYAFRRNDTGIARGDAFTIIKPSQPTVPAMLQKAGYTTAAVGKWHLGLGDESGQDWNGYMTPGPKQLGFDYSYIMAATGDRTPCVYFENQQAVGLDPNDPIEVSYTTPFPGEPLGKTHPELVTKMRPSLNHGHDQAIINGISRIGYMKGGKSALWVDENIADSITAKAVAFIENNKDKPFFLYFGTNDIHVPRVPHPRFAGKSGMGPRGDAILEFDWTVGQVLDALERNGLAGNTIVILTSDNGPVVDDGYQDRAVELLGEHKPWGPLRGGKYSAFDAGTRVPFIISWPDSMEKGKASPALVSQIDMFATLAALTTQALPAEGPSDSSDQLGAWMGKDQKGRDYVVEQSVSTLSIIRGDWKYIVPCDGEAFWPLTATETGFSKEPQLYNLSDDIGEKNNLAARNPEKVKELSTQIEQIKTNSK